MADKCGLLTKAAEEPITAVSPGWCSGGSSYESLFPSARFDAKRINPVTLRQQVTPPPSSGFKYQAEDVVLCMSPPAVFTLNAQKVLFVKRAGSCFTFGPSSPPWCLFLPKGQNRCSREFLHSPRHILYIYLYIYIYKTNYIYLYIYIYLYMYILYTFIYIYIFISIYLYIFIYVYIYIYIFISIYLYTSIYMYKYIYINIYIYIYINIYILGLSID